MPVFLALILGVKWNINLEYGLSLLGSGEVINVRISQADLALLRELTLLCLFFKAHQSQAPAPASGCSFVLKLLVPQESLNC